YFASLDQALVDGEVAQQRRAPAHHVFAEPAAKRTRRRRGLVGIDVVRELQLATIAGQQPDIEVLGVEQLADRMMDVAVEAFAVLVGVRQRGDLVQRRL